MFEKLTKATQRSSDQQRKRRQNKSRPASTHRKRLASFRLDRRANGRRISVSTDLQTRFETFPCCWCVAFKSRNLLEPKLGCGINFILRRGEANQPAVQASCFVVIDRKSCNTMYKRWRNVDVKNKNKKGFFFYIHLDAKFVVCEFETPL
jgi:hypothetical protein